MNDCYSTPFSFGGDKGAYGETCTSFRCQLYTRVKPKATFYSTVNKRWVCLQCAQAENTFAMKTGEPRPCINSKEFMMKILTE